MRIALAVLLLAPLAACTDDSCAAYVSYMCDCHGADEEVNCSDLETIYSNADADLQAECAIALEDQQDEDDDEGYACGTGDDTAGDTGV